MKNIRRGRRILKDFIRAMRPRRLAIVPGGGFEHEPLKLARYPDTDRRRPVGDDFRIHPFQKIRLKPEQGRNAAAANVDFLLAQIETAGAKRRLGVPGGDSQKVEIPIEDARHLVGGSRADDLRNLRLRYGE